MRSELLSESSGRSHVRSGRRCPTVAMMESAYSRLRMNPAHFVLANIQWLDAPECPSPVQGACGRHDSRLDTQTQGVGDGFR